MTESEQFIESITMQEDSFNKLIAVLKGQYSREIKIQAAFALEPSHRQEVIAPLIHAAREAGNDYNGTFMYVLCAFDCRNYLKDILLLGLDGSSETRSHVCDILNNTEGVTKEDKAILLTSLKLKKELVMNEKVVLVEDMEFLEDCEYLVKEIPEKTKATVINMFKK